MKIKPEQDWWQPAAELIVREGLALPEAATRLQIPINTLEARNTFRSQAFQRLLRTERNRYFREVGTNPEYSKKSVIGKLLVCAEELFQRGEFDKCAEVLLKACKAEGWVGEAGNVNVFAGMTGRDLDQIRAKLRDRADAEAKEAKPN